MTKLPWRTKESPSAIFTATKPGQCVSVDHMESTQVGFFAQLKGILTLRRYRAATVFVDHFSGYKYIHLMSHLSSVETVAAKVAFERHASDLGVSILHYHADNGKFQDNAFRAACE
jgi:transposase InsO family protein